MKEEQNNLQELMENRDITIASFKESRDGMESKMDDLFSDLVKLAQMYEVVEKEAEDRRVNSEELSRELEEQQKQKRTAEQRLRSENELLRAENEKLQKKLARYREKLEADMKEERKGAVAHRAAQLDSNSNRSSVRSNARYDVSSKSHKQYSHDSRGKENVAYFPEVGGSIPKDETRKKESRYAYESNLSPRDKDKDTSSRRKELNLHMETQRHRTESQYRHRSYR